MAVTDGIADRTRELARLVACASLVTLFDRSVERIHIDMDDLALRAPRLATTSLVLAVLSSDFAV